MFRIILAVAAIFAVATGAYYAYAWITDQGPVPTGDYVRSNCLKEASCTMVIRWTPLEGYNMRLVLDGFGDCNPVAYIRRTDLGYEGRWFSRPLEDRSLTIKLKTEGEKKVVTLAAEGLTCGTQNSGMNFLPGDYVER